MTVPMVQPQNNALVSPVPAAPPASPDAKERSMGFSNGPADALRPMLCTMLGVEQLKLSAMTHGDGALAKVSTFLCRVHSTLCRYIPCAGCLFSVIPER